MGASGRGACSPRARPLEVSDLLGKIEIMRETTEPRAWLVCGSENWAYGQWMLDNSYIAVNLSKASDLSPGTDLPAMLAQFAPEVPGKSEQAIGNYAAQLHVFANRMAGEVLPRLLKHYEVPPEEIRTRIPLKRVWLMDQAEG